MSRVVSVVLANARGESRVRLRDGQVVRRVVHGVSYSPRKGDEDFFTHSWVVFDGHRRYVRRMQPEPPRQRNGVLWLAYEEYDCEQCRNRGMVTENLRWRPCLDCWPERGGR